jgi:hypothetical protein
MLGGPPEEANLSDHNQLKELEDKFSLASPDYEFIRRS